MKIYSVNDPEFAEYGKVLTGYDTTELIKAMEEIAMPEGVDYKPWIDSLEACKIFKELGDNAYGGISALEVIEHWPLSSHDHTETGKQPSYISVSFNG